MNKFICCLPLCLSISALAAPSNDDMARCAAITAADTRLACYDALAHRPAEIDRPKSRQLTYLFTR